METFITSLVERVSNEDIFLSMRAPKHQEGDIRNKPCGRVWLFEAFKRGLELKDTRRHSTDKMSCNQNCIPPQVRWK